MAVKKRLGEMLVESKLLTEDQLKQALAEQKRAGLKLGQYVTRQGLLSENQIVYVGCPQHLERRICSAPHRDGALEQTNPRIKDGLFEVAHVW